jgi:hypothetical protein
LEQKMKLLMTAALAASLITTNLYAADATAPLAPGKAAGVHKAQDASDDTLWWLLGGAAVVAIIAVAASSGGNSSTPTAAVSGTA